MIRSTCPVPNESFLTTPDAPQGLYTFSLQSGEVIAFDTERDLFGVSGEIIVYRQTNNNRLEVRNRVSDELMWTLDLNSRDFRDSYLVGIADERVIIGFNRFRLDAYDVQTGGLVWTLSYTTESLPILHDDQITYYLADDQFRILDVVDGSRRFELTLNHQPPPEAINITTAMFPTILTAINEYVAIADIDSNEVVMISHPVSSE